MGKGKKVESDKVEAENDIVITKIPSFLVRVPFLRNYDLQIPNPNFEGLFMTTVVIFTLGIHGFYPFKGPRIIKTANTVTAKTRAACTFEYDPYIAFKLILLYFFVKLCFSKFYFICTLFRAFSRLYHWTLFFVS